MKFEDLDLNDDVLDALYDMRFEECTPIQEKCIPVILSGKDVLGVAQTGTGKTAAYLLPILSKLDDGGYPKEAVNCVIMSPTRELAQQIDQAMQGFAYYMPDVSSVAVYGGNDGNRYCHSNCKHNDNRQRHRTRHGQCQRPQYPLLCLYRRIGCRNRNQRPDL